MPELQRASAASRAGRLRGLTPPTGPTNESSRFARSGHINDDGASEVVGNGLGEEDQGESRDEHSEGCAQKQEVGEAIRSVHRIEWLTTSARGEEAGSQATQEGTSVHESPRLAVVWGGRGVAASGLTTICPSAPTHAPLPGTSAASP
jgi:hypothetical protein